MIAVWALLAMVFAGVYLGVAARHGAPATFHFVQTVSPVPCPVLSDTSTCFSLQLRNTGPEPTSLVCASKDIATGETVEFDNGIHEYHTGVLSSGETRTIGVWVTIPAGGTVTSSDVPIACMPE